jgi:hypothetical protein
MIRSLDFTVEPDKTYRFRVRVAVYNPNQGREDVSPGVDTKAEELLGPWSEPTNEVTMPADVATYALRKTQGVGRQAEQVHFQVVKWNPEDGVTVPKFFDAGPGEIIGERSNAYVPASDGTGKKSKPIDFYSHQVVLDTSGGNPRVPEALGRGTLEVPAVSLLVRPDGAVMLRTQMADVSDEVRKDMDASYKRELEESSKKRDASMGSYGSSMMPAGR